MIQRGNVSDTDSRATAFLRWAGGKALFAREIVKHFPSPEKTQTYYEPFLGAGSVFFFHKPRNAVLSDLNRALVNTFTAVKHHPNKIAAYLSELAQPSVPE